MIEALRREIRDSAVRVQPLVRHTPCLTLAVPTSRGEREVVLKLESLQVTGSFKPRGAVNSLLLSDAPHVVACSGGNHGLAVAWAAHRLGRRATVVVPASAARSKVDAMRHLGAEIVEHGDTPGEAFAYADELVAEQGLPLVHPYDQRPTVVGQGTLGLELTGDAPEVTHWLVAVGGGGLPAGIVAALGGAADVVPVEPEGCPTLAMAQRAGHPVPSPATGVARTSLGAPRLGTLAWEVLSSAVGPSTLVTDGAILQAQRWLWREVRVVAEPGGATALAALMTGAWAPGADARIGVLVCGGNADALPDA